MKRLLTIVAVCLLASCTGKADKAQSCAQGFLDAFLSNDFNSAASYCTDDFNIDFNQAMEDFSKLDDSVKILLKEQCSQLKAEVVSVERVNESDTFSVNYNIVSVCPDSSGVAAEQGLITSTLKVVDGKVASLNK